MAIWLENVDVGWFDMNSKKSVDVGWILCQWDITSGYIATTSLRCDVNDA